jgi:ribosomal protein S18 acetylase RimI-like enzyme
MYVRPRGRGHGAGRALLTHLLAEARALGYGTVRLETAIFMTEAQRLYESMGFRQRARFPGGEANLSGLDAAMRFLELRLEVDPTAVARRRTRPAAQGPGHHGREQDRRDSARRTMAA